jgi:hypothetical protein
MANDMVKLTRGLNYSLKAVDNCPINGGASQVCHNSDSQNRYTQEIGQDHCEGSAL